MRFQEIQEHYDVAFRRGVIPFLSCEECGKSFFYPSTRCRKCGSARLDKRLSAGEGKVFAITRFRAKDFGEVSYGIVQMEEGFRLYCNFEEFGSNLEVDSGVKVGAMGETFQLLARPRTL